MDITLVLLPDEDGEKPLLHQVLEGARRGQSVYAEIDRSQCQHVSDALVTGDRLQPWGVTDYMATLAELATALDLSLTQCAERFGVATVRPNDNGWRYHPTLGFSQRR